MGIGIGVLISGNGSNLQAIIDACEAGRIDGNVTFVGSDRPDVYGLERAKKHGIANFVVDYSQVIKFFHDNPAKRIMPKEIEYFATIVNKQSIYSKEMKYTDLLEKLFTRVNIECKLLREMDKFSFDVLALAGFMRNLSPYFIDKINIDPFHPRIMNIHPALLPAFPGTDGYGDTFAYGCKIGGCTVHFVDYGEDTGPIIGQRMYEITPEDNPETIKTKGLAQEWKLYTECLQLFAQERLMIVSRQLGNRPPKKVVDILPAE